jgi:alpha-tubulin suppressor-like RCC1 family protein
LHSLALKNDGTVWAWGWNEFGQLGDGTVNDSAVPVQVRNLSGVTAIAAGQDHCLALKGDGSVWAWGANFSGDLGDGTTEHRNVPVQVQNLGGVTAIAAGDMHSLALKGDTTVRAWGENNVGQLGDGTTMERHTPVQVLTEPLVIHPEAAGSIIAPGSSLSGVTAIAAGVEASLALMGDGSVWAWGPNTGDGTFNARLTARPVPHVNGVILIAASAHNLAARRDAVVAAWGQNEFGQLGDGTIFNRAQAVTVQTLGENLSAVTAVSAGTAFSLVAGVPLTQLTVTKIVVNANTNHQRLFNLLIDGAPVLSNINGGSTGPLAESPGNHTVSETAGVETLLSSFGTVIGGACAADGTVNLALGDNKTCTITNFDNTGGCASGTFCCEPGTGIQPCAVCIKVGHECR